MYSIFRRNKPQVYPKVILPALASGIMWGIAMGKPICIHLPIYPSLHLYIRVYLLIHMSISSPLHTCISIDTYVHLFTSTYMYIYPYICPSLHLYIHVYLSIHMSISSPLHTCISIHTYINSSVQISLYLYIIQSLTISISSSVGWFVANEHLSLAVSFPIITAVS